MLRRARHEGTRTRRFTKTFFVQLRDLEPLWQNALAFNTNAQHPLRGEPMRKILTAGLVAASLIAIPCSGSALAQGAKRTLAERLGFAATDKILIVNVDDVGAATPRMPLPSTLWRTG